MSIHVMVRFLRKWPQNELELRVLRFVSFHSTSTLFLPLVNILLEGFWCGGGAQRVYSEAIPCETSGRTMVLIVLVVLLVSFIPLTFFTTLVSQDRDPASPSWEACAHGHVHAYMLLVKLVLAILLQVLPPKSLSGWEMLVFLVLTGLAWVFLVIRSTPWITPWMNAAQVATAGAFTFACMCTMVAKALGGSTVFMLLFLGFPGVGVLVYMVMMAQLMRVVASQLADLTRAKDICMWASWRLQARASLCGSTTVPHELIDGTDRGDVETNVARVWALRTGGIPRSSSETRDVCHALFLEADRAFSRIVRECPDDEASLLVAASFQEHHTPHIFFESNILSRVLAQNPSMDAEFHCFRRSHELRHRSSELSNIDHILFEQKLQEVRECRMKELRDISTIWSALASRIPDMGVVLQAARKLAKHVSRVDSLYADLMRMNPESPKVLRGLAEHVASVRMNSRRAQQLLNKAESIENSYASQVVLPVRRFLLGRAAQSIATKQDCPLLRISGSTSSPANIISVNLPFLRLIGCSAAAELVHQPIDAVVPAPFARLVTNAICNANSALANSIIGMPRYAVVQHGLGHLVPVIMIVNESTPSVDTFEPRLDVSFAAVACDEEVILFGDESANWRVFGMSERAQQVLGLGNRIDVGQIELSMDSLFVDVAGSPVESRVAITSSQAAWIASVHDDVGVSSDVFRDTARLSTGPGRASPKQHPGQGRNISPVSGHSRHHSTTVVDVFPTSSATKPSAFIPPRTEGIDVGSRTRDDKLDLFPAQDMVEARVKSVFAARSLSLLRLRVGSVEYQRVLRKTSGFDLLAPFEDQSTSSGSETSDSTTNCSSLVLGAVHSTPGLDGVYVLCVRPLQSLEVTPALSATPRAPRTIPPPKDSGSSSQTVRRDRTDGSATRGSVLRSPPHGVQQRDETSSVTSAVRQLVVNPGKYNDRETSRILRAVGCLGFFVILGAVLALVLSPIWTTNIVAITNALLADSSRLSASSYAYGSFVRLALLNISPAFGVLLAQSSDTYELFINRDTEIMGSVQEYLFSVGEQGGQLAYNYTQLHQVSYTDPSLEQVKTSTLAEFSSIMSSHYRRVVAVPDETSLSSPSALFLVQNADLWLDELRITFSKRHEDFIDVFEDTISKASVAFSVYFWIACLGTVLSMASCLYLWQRRVRQISDAVLRIPRSIAVVQRNMLTTNMRAFQEEDQVEETRTESETASFGGNELEIEKMENEEQWGAILRSSNLIDTEHPRGYVNSSSYVCRMCARLSSPILVVLVFVSVLASWQQSIFVRVEENGHRLVALQMASQDMARFEKAFSTAYLRNDHSMLNETEEFADMVMSSLRLAALGGHFPNLPNISIGPVTDESSTVYQVLVETMCLRESFPYSNESCSLLGHGMLQGSIRDGAQQVLSTSLHALRKRLKNTNSSWEDYDVLIDVEVAKQPFFRHVFDVTAERLFQEMVLDVHRFKNGVSLCVWIFIPSFILVCVCIVAPARLSLRNHLNGAVLLLAIIPNELHRHLPTLRRHVVSIAQSMSKDGVSPNEESTSLAQNICIFVTTCPTFSTQPAPPNETSPFTNPPPLHRRPADIRPSESSSIQVQGGILE